MIRSLILQLKSDYLSFHYPGNISGTRDSIWRDWSIYLFNDDSFMSPRCSERVIHFPNLEKLVLDFTEWRLTETDGLLVSCPVFLATDLWLTNIGQAVHKETQTQ